jgi:uncharacterized protein (DUF1697 family)
MPRYVAFLRGVNLGATRKTGSAELRSCFEELGFTSVASFRTSGNVVFEAGREARRKLSARIEQGLERSFGFAVTVFLRSASEVAAIAEHEPFDPELVAASKGKLQVSLLASKPSPKTRKAALALATADDRLAFHGTELYWLPSGGTRDSALDQKTLDKLVRPTTMRTMGTVQQLAAKHFADARGST